MIYLARSFFYFGEVTFAFGLIWFAMHVHRNADLLPAAFVQPASAIVITVLGAILMMSGFILKRKSQCDLQPSASLEPEFQSDWSDPQFRTRVRGFLKDAVQADIDKSRDVLREQYGLGQSRVALKAVWPQRPTKSWVGGLPALPDGMGWPSFDGRPASFLAQISLEGLPDTLWQGLGPRKGSLVFFTDPQQSTSVAVRHVTGKLTFRPQPQGVQHNWDYGTEPAGLIDESGLRHDIAPRWFLEVSETPALGAVQDIASGLSDYWDDEKGEPIWAPTWPELARKADLQIRAREDLRLGYDWPSFFTVFGCWRDWLEDQACRNATMAERAPRDAAQAEEREQRKLEELQAEAEADPWIETALEKHIAEMDRMSKLRSRLAEKYATTSALLQKLCPEVEKLETELRDIAMERPFDPAFSTAFAESMAAFDIRLSAVGADSARPHMEQAQPHAIATYARTLFTQEPEALPQALHDILAPVWEVQCRETVVFMGLDHEGREGLQPDARLIDLPSNPLCGLMFGDDSRFYVDLPALALQEQDWTKARSCDTHGL